MLTWKSLVAFAMIAGVAPEGCELEDSPPPPSECAPPVLTPTILSPTEISPPEITVEGMVLVTDGVSDAQLVKELNRQFAGNRDLPAGIYELTPRFACGSNCIPCNVDPNLPACTGIPPLPPVPRSSKLLLSLGTH